MATLFSDNFNRADGAIGSTNWTAFNHTNPGGGGTAATNIVSNQAKVTDADGDIDGAYCTTTAHAAVADCRATVTRISGALFDGGPLVRKQGTADTCYYLDVTAGTTTATVYRRIAGVDTSVGTASLGSEAAGDVYGLEASGTGATVSIKVYKGGVQVGSTLSDSNAARITGTGQTGFLTWAPTANSIFDDFLAEDLASADTLFAQACL